MKKDFIPAWMLTVIGVFILLGVVLLSGCSPYWVRVKEPAEHVQVIYHLSENDVERAYKNIGRSLKVGESLYGFSVRAGSLCYVHVVAGDTCGLRHELAHCEGFDHDDREAFTKDCGP